MSVIFTKEAEKERWFKENNPKSAWELYSGYSLVQAVRTARDLGWGDKKVQVRYEKDENNNIVYYVEPYEEGCGCKGLLKYHNYFE